MALKLKNFDPQVTDSKKKKIQCRYCDNFCVKNGKQRYKCLKCGKNQQSNYSYNAYDPNTNDNIIALTKEGVELLSTARLLKVIPTK